MTRVMIGSLTRKLTQAGTIAIAVLTMTAHADACRGGQASSAFVLNSLPPTAMQESVVARVAILEVMKPPYLTYLKIENWDSSSRVKLRVVEAIKGVTLDQTLIGDGAGTTCDQSFSRSGPEFDAKKNHYIAGRFEINHLGETVFRGDWTSDGPNAELRKVR